jgi:hypothetical protein
MAIRLLLVAVSVLAVVYGCGQASSPAERHERAAGAQEAAAESATPSAEGTTTVGPVFAKVDLEPVGDSATRATAVFKEVGDLGVQVELAASGLPKPGAEYFSQIHEGSCAGVQGQEEEEEGGDHRHEHDGDHDHQHGGVGPAVALIRLNSILAEAPEQANGGHDHSGAPADELPGNIDYPLVFSSSTDGGAFVGTLLEGVAPEEVVSGKPKYIDVHPSDSEDSRTLSCADLSDAN